MKEQEMQAVERAVRILIGLMEQQRLEEEKVEERRQSFKIVNIEDWKRQHTQI